MTTQAQTTSSTSIAAETTLGAVALTVSDLDRSKEFYERVIGLRSFDRSDGGISLGVTQAHPLVELFGDGAAPALSPRAPGLYHIAILLPSRRDLAFALARLADARWPLAGGADHLVSEALYLADPDGIGIEIYRDRPRNEWIRTGGELQLASEPLDLEGVLGEIDGGPERPPQAPAGTTVGHVHLQVASLGETENFYHRVLGFDVTVRSYPGALFLSAGDYHHHIGANTWQSAGSSPPLPGAIGLRQYEVVLENEDARERVLGRLRAADVPAEGDLVRDPSGNRLRLAVN